MMAFLVVPSAEAATEPMWVSDRKLWKTTDGRVVEDGDPAAAVLYATPGDPVRLVEAQTLGLVVVDPPAEPDTKMRQKAHDKQRKLRDAQQKERESLRERQARERADTPETETESTDG